MTHRRYEKKQDTIMSQVLSGNAAGHIPATCSECSETNFHTRSLRGLQTEKEDGEEQEKRSEELSKEK